MDYLITTNRNMYKEIMSFVDRYGNVSASNFARLSEFLLQIQQWTTAASADYETTQRIENSIYSLCKVYPSILRHSEGFYKNVPSHWGLSSNHETDVCKIIAKYYEALEKYKDDPVLVKLLAEIETRLVDIHMFVQTIPHYSDIVKTVGTKESGEPDVRTFHVLFDRTTIQHLYAYCLYSVLYEYMLCTDEVELLRADKEVIKRDRRDKIREGRDRAQQFRGVLQTVGEDEEDAMMDLHEVQIHSGNIVELKERVCELLLICMGVEQDTNEKVQMTYDQVIQKSKRLKEAEKRGIISYLGTMSKEERSIEQMFKTYKLGRWNVGEQKGLFAYDKETYERERLEMVAQMGEDTGKDFDMVHQMRLDVYDLDREREAMAEEEEREELDIGQWGANFMDGEYYDDDREENLFGDE
jgi:hypothetical protein